MARPGGASSFGPGGGPPPAPRRRPAAPARGRRGRVAAPAERGRGAQRPPAALGRRGGAAFLRPPPGRGSTLGVFSAPCFPPLPAAPALPVVRRRWPRAAAPAAAAP